MTFGFRGLGISPLLALLALYGATGTLDLTEILLRPQASPSTLTLWPGMRRMGCGPGRDPVTPVVGDDEIGAVSLTCGLIGTIEALTPVSAFDACGYRERRRLSRQSPCSAVRTGSTTPHLMFGSGDSLDRRHRDADAKPV